MAPGDSTPPTPEDAIQQGLDAPVPEADGQPAPISDGHNWQQQLLVTLAGLNETLQSFQRREADQPIKSEKLQPAPSLNDLFQQQEPEPEHQPEPELPDQQEQPEPEPVKFEQFANVALAPGQQQAGVNMGQGANNGAALGQMQALLQQQQQANQQTVGMLQALAAMIGQLIQMQQQHLKDIDDVNRQIEGLKARVDALSAQMQAGQQRNPQNWNNNP